MSNHTIRKFKSGAMSTLAISCSILVVLPLVFVLIYLIKQGLSGISPEFFTHLPKAVGETGGGMANAIVGSIELLALAFVIGVPLGLLGGIFLSEYGTPRVNATVRFLADVLNGVPSIVWGMVAYSLLVVPMKSFSAYAGGLSLGLIMIPLVLRTTEEMLVLVPRRYREAALALGISRWKMVLHIILRTALKGIVTGVIVALARVAGETAPLLFTAFGNHFWSRSLHEPIAALPLQIFVYAISPYDDWHAQAWAGALVLVALIFVMSLGMRFLTRDRGES